MAHHLVDGDADAFREAFVAQGGRNGAVFDGIVMHQVVDFQRTHARMDFLAHEVEDGRINHAALLNAFYLFGGADEAAFGHRCTLGFHRHHFLVQCCRFLSGRHTPFLTPVKHNALILGAKIVFF